MKPFLSILVALAWSSLLGQAAVVDDFHAMLERLNTAILNAYDGTPPPQTAQGLNQAWQVLLTNLNDPQARALVPSNFKAASPPQELANAASLSQENNKSSAALVNQRLETCTSPHL